MIIDVTGTILIPGNSGKNCSGNGFHKDSNCDLIECCCDECDYMICCLPSHNPKECKTCDIYKCPNSKSPLKLKKTIYEV